MKKLLIILFTFLLLGCSKETTNEVLEPVFEISLDGESFDAYERYSKIETFGAERLDRQHFALYCLDSDANDDGEILDVGTYTWESPDGKYAGVEIPGPDDYIVWNEVIVQDAGQLGGAHSGLICLTAVGEFYNPYIQRTMSVNLKLENFPIGLDIDATPYGYLLN